ncbi:MAG TPA: hypothetical protein VGK33_08920, partial [Chloroflexota bacterium]
ACPVSTHACRMAWLQTYELLRDEAEAERGTVLEVSPPTVGLWDAEARILRHQPSAGFAPRTS